MSQSRKKYDRAFKLRTVELSYECDSIVGLAAELGLRPELIYRWRSELTTLKEKSFPGEGKKSLTPEEAEISRLKKRLADKETELEILKKAIGIFSRKDGKSMRS